MSTEKMRSLPLVFTKSQPSEAVVIWKGGARKCADDVLFTKRTSEQSGLCSDVVPAAGLEPARHRWQWILSPPRLPIPTRRQTPINEPAAAPYPPIMLYYYSEISYTLQAGNTEFTKSFCRPFRHFLRRRTKCGPRGGYGVLYRLGREQKTCAFHRTVLQSV